MSAPTPRRVLVTGAGGFLGRHVAGLLRQRGHEVIAVASSRERGDDARSADLCDGAAVARMIAEASPAVVLHLAARATSPGDPWRTVFLNNVESTRNVLEGALAQHQRPRVLLASSSAVFGALPREPVAIGEDCGTMPVTLYGASKLACEGLASHARAQGLPVTVCRAFNLIGPGGDTRSAAANWARVIAEAAVAGAPFELRCGPLETARDLTDVRDAAAAYAALVEGGEELEVVHLCTGQAHTGAEVLALLRRIAGIDGSVYPAAPRAGDIAYQRGDPSLLRRTTGWSPRHTLEDSLRDLYAESLLVAQAAAPRAPRSGSN